MKMKNKIELKKALILSVLIIIVFNIIFSILSYHQYREYTTNLNNKVAAIITKLNEQYPELNKAQIADILNNDDIQDRDILKKYGIDLDKDSIILENDDCFNHFLVLNLLLITFSSVLLLIVFIKYSKVEDEKICKITEYIEQINNKNYSLNIEENTEDELSILKNEIYKITVMLKEAADNSFKDKLQIKDSLSDISHQLKTPLTSITIMLDNILDNPQMDEDTRNGFVRDMKRAAMNINFLVQSLLAISSLDVNSVHFINKDVKIKDILDESMKNIEALCDLKDVCINIYGDENIKINCDFKWQVEAVTNVLKNCVEHSNTNSSINVYCEKNKIYSQIKIQDFGVGIDEEDLPHIFERFYKGKNASSNSIGIGLALAKSIIEKNDGYIEVDSQINKGTIFRIKYFNKI